MTATNNSGSVTVNVVSAVESGEISIERIDESVIRCMRVFSMTSVLWL